VDKQKLKGKILRLIIIFIMIILMSSFNTYAADSKFILPGVEVEVNQDILKMQERRLPSVYLGNIEKTYKYNIFDNEKIKLNVKDQGNTETCWACSSNSVLETTINLANNTNHIFSHLDLANDVSNKYGISVNAGANAYIAYGHYTSGELPTNMNKEKVNVKIEDYTIFPTVYKEINENTITYKKEMQSTEQYTEQEVNTIRKSIKNHILNYGAVTAVTYSNATYFSNNLQSYYCNNNEVLPNHQVTIVGWNDNYEKENFKTQPKNDGAYIVLNSYGENFGLGGLFYISYEDALVEYCNFGITETSSYKEEENIYQYDEFGINNEIGFLVDVYAANVYTRKTKKIEKITSVGFSSLENGEYEIYINPDNDDLDITKMRKVKEITTRKSRIYNSRI